MADDIKSLSAQLAQDPASMVFLRLAELLRQREQLDAAHRVALSGLERHPHVADAHDLYARILADKGDYERAFDEWDMAVRIAPGHIGALKGLSFLYFKVGDVDQAVAHLESARRHSPDDPSIAQAIGGRAGRTSRPSLRQSRRTGQEPAATAAAAMPRSKTRGCSPASKARRRDCCCSTPRGRVLGGALSQSGRRRRHRCGGCVSRRRVAGSVAHRQAAWPRDVDRARDRRGPGPRASRPAYTGRVAPRGAGPRHPDGTACHQWHNGLRTRRAGGWSNRDDGRPRSSARWT